MPERWEHELKKLRKVEQPSTLEDRVAEGPNAQHDPGRPTRERVAAAVVAFAVCAAVGVFGYRTLSNDDADGGSHVATGVPSGDEALVLDLRAGADAPTATLSYGDETQVGVVEGYNWCPDGTTDGASCTSGIADFAFYPPVTQYLVVPPGTPIEVTGDGSVDDLAFEDAIREADQLSSSSAVPVDDSRYALKLRARWSNGDATVWFGVQVLSSEAAAPVLLTVDCRLGLIRTDTSVVRTSPDGLHIRYYGSDSAHTFEILSPDGQRYAIGGGASLDARSTWSLDPGPWLIGCGRDVDIASAVPFELVDPDDHYAPWELACGEVRPTAFISGVRTSIPHDQAASEIAQGLQGGDRMRGAGYGAETFKLGPTYVVDRGGASVARIVLGEADGVWVGTLAACPDSGVTFLNATPAPATTGTTGPDISGSGATGATAATVDDATGASGGATPVADKLMVRCEGLGPAVDVEQVRLQPDGLFHYEATNVADADWIVFEAEDPMTPPFGQPFDTVTVEGTIRTFTPGTYWVGCRVLDETGGFDGSHLDHPEAYVRFEVLPAEA
jgi:hypothetical protein